MPKAVIALSPCTDQYAPLHSHHANIKTDTMLGDAVEKGLTDVLFDEKPSKEQLKDPYLSPYYGNFAGLPPIYLSCSDSEVLRDDSILLYEKLKAEGHRTGMDVYKGQCHAFQIFPWIPEARDALNKAFAFAESDGKE